MSDKKAIFIRDYAKSLVLAGKTCSLCDFASVLNAAGFGHYVSHARGMGRVVSAAYRRLHARGVECWQILDAFVGNSGKVLWMNK